MSHPNRNGVTVTLRQLGLTASLLVVFPLWAFGDESPPQAVPILRQYCIDCHANGFAEAGINLEQMTAEADFGARFRDWEKVAGKLRAREMPPEEMPQPSDAERRAVVDAIEDGFEQYIEDRAGDPGAVALRRLTSAEYAYTIEDLTGLQLNVADRFVSDAVSGEGFTNAAGAQFMQDSTLERYLEAAKVVASHAVIGAGPIEFFADPGETGRELFAISRIQQIYREHGFRTAAGEGAKPFGLDLYPRAMFVAWQYRYRDELGLGNITVAELAEDEGISVRLCEHLWSVLNSNDALYPLSVIVDRWQALPSPADLSPEQVRRRCDELADELREWQDKLTFAAGSGERATVLTDGDVHVSPVHSFETEIRWEPKTEIAEFALSISGVGNQSPAGALVIWRNPQVRFRDEDFRRHQRRPLRASVSAETAERLAFGQHPAGASLGENDFVSHGEVINRIALVTPPEMVEAELTVDVELDTQHGASRIVRCLITETKVRDETAARVGDVSALIGDPDSAAVAEWQAAVAEFAKQLPEVSHREPTPSDRDPIPAPFDNAYNEPERNHFHYAIKYHRDDAFFMRHIADNDTRRQLNQAWTDLLTSFDYHDAFLRFTAEKFSLELEGRAIADLDQQAIDQLPEGHRPSVQDLYNEYHAMHEALRAAEPGHGDDVLQFAERAWRRPLSANEQERLRGFYNRLRDEDELKHPRAIRTLLARILVAPAFLYRVEPPTERAGIVPLSDWQLASRLSYFLWSSGPDDELRQVAAEGRLTLPEEFEQQTRRMLRDEKARRLATEFFGQWLGFYRFDEFRGIDTERFPKFTGRLKSDLYDEAISFFEHIIREDRSVDDILFADYTFLNRRLAEHYGLPAEGVTDNNWTRIDQLAEHHRGGVLGMGAVLASTSAPLRTSAVKRGDWVLRRLVGTPVPPPPPDAGSITADDVASDGLTVRQRLEAHRSQASCMNCHSRIDPLGFALEPFDPIGRWRETYRDGQPIDASGVLRDGTELSGPDGLRNYLRREKAKFHRTLCTKLLGYALGRSELLSDRPLIHDMMQGIDAGEPISDLIVHVVLSDQFRTQRSE